MSKFTMDRAMEATNTLELQADTLAGDIRDGVLDLLRGMEKPWTKLAEHEQRNRIYAATNLARRAVRGSVKLVAERGLDAIEVAVGPTTLDEDIKIKVVAPRTEDAATAIVKHGRGTAVLCFTSAGAFFGERAEALADLDQPELPIAGETETAGSGDAAADADTSSEAKPLGTVSEQALAKLKRPRRQRGDRDPREVRATLDAMQAEDAAAVNAAALKKGIRELPAGEGAEPEQPAAPPIPEPVA